MASMDTVRGFAIGLQYPGKMYLCALPSDLGRGTLNLSRLHASNLTFDMQ